MISVIIPTYNRNKILCDTIEQILNQDYKDFELLIIDQTKQHDENTVKFLANLPGNAKVVKVKNPNLPAARNIGIKNSVGDIIIFFDDDMNLPENTLAKVAKVYNERKDLFALTGFGDTPGHLQESKYSILNKRDREKISDGIPEITQVSTFNGYFMTFRKNLFNQVGLFDEWIGTQPKAAAEDFEFCLRIKKRGFKLFLLTDLTVTHLALTYGGCEARKDIDCKADMLLENRTKLRFYSVYKNINNKKFNELGKAFAYNFYTYFAPILKSAGIINCFKSIPQFFKTNKVAYQNSKLNLIVKRD